VCVLELDRSQHLEGIVPTLAIVEDLDVLEHRVGQFDPRFHRFPFRSSVCILPQKDSMTPLSYTVGSSELRRAVLCTRFSLVTVRLFPLISATLRGWVSTPL